MKRDKIISDETLLLRNNDLLTSNLDGEVVLLSVDNAEYYGLGEIGTFIWEQLATTISFSDLINRLLEAYDVDRKQCIQDTLPFVEELLKKNVIEIADE